MIFIIFTKWCFNDSNKSRDMKMVILSNTLFKYLVKTLEVFLSLYFQKWPVVKVLVQGKDSEVEVLDSTKTSIKKKKRELHTFSRKVKKQSVDNITVRLMFVQTFVFNLFVRNTETYFKCEIHTLYPQYLHLLLIHLFQNTLHEMSFYKLNGC